MTYSTPGVNIEKIMLSEKSRSNKTTLYDFRLQDVLRAVKFRDSGCGCQGLRRGGKEELLSKDAVSVLQDEKVVEIDCSTKRMYWMPLNYTL